MKKHFIILSILIMVNSLSVLSHTDDEVLEWARKCSLGIDCKQDYGNAAFNYVYLAEKNIPEAQYRLGLAYEYGLGVEVDYTESLNWFKKAAEQGEVHAMWQLVYYYDFGIGTEENRQERDIWKNRALSKSYTKYEPKYEADVSNENIYDWYRSNRINSRYYTRDLTINNVPGFNYHIISEGATTDYYRAIYSSFGVTMAHDPLCLNQIGIMNYNKGQYDIAFKYLSEATESGYHSKEYALMLWNGKGVKENKIGALSILSYLNENQVITNLVKQLVQNPNNSDNMHILSHCYEEGWGVPQDSQESERLLKEALQRKQPGAFYCLANKMLNEGQEYDAVQLFREASNLGYAPAMTNLGCCYMNGDGVDEKDVNTAINYFEKAAEMGHSRANYLLGQSYYSGIGKKENDNKAVHYYEKAAELGDSEAQYMLAYCYDNAIGVKANAAKAIEWYRRSAHQGNDDAFIQLGSFYWTPIRDGVDSIIADNPKEAARLFKKSATKGNSEAQWYLSEYYSGNWMGTPEDEDSCAYYLELAAENGNYWAEFKKGCNLAELDPNSAMSWWKKSFEHGCAEAATAIGTRYERGCGGVSQCYELAAEWYLKGSEMGDLNSDANLCELYLKGWGVPKNPSKAFFYAKRGIDAPEASSRAMRILSICYRDGHGTYPDPVLAEEWYEKAAQARDSKARNNLNKTGKNYSWNSYYNGVD